MISNPKPNQYVQVWYNQRRAPSCPLHGRTGTVAVVSSRRPRNHGVMVGGVLYVVPAGNLRRPLG